MRHQFTHNHAMTAHSPLSYQPLAAPMMLAQPHLLRPAVTRFLTVTIASLALALMLISLRPFKAMNVLNAAAFKGGDPVNQVGFLIAGSICLLALLCLANRKVLFSVFSPVMMLLGIVLVFNLLRAPDPASTFRGLTLTLIGMLVAFTVVALPRNQVDFRIVLTIGAGAALALSYGGVLFFPQAAIHGVDVEPQHLGLWRGHFTHKNIAGPIMCIIAFFGIYLIRSGQRISGFAMLVAAAIFLHHTGSKTTEGFFPITIMIVMLAILFGRASFAIGGAVLAISFAGIMTLGTLFSPTISKIAGFVTGDPTYTGRTTLWEFGASMIPAKPWFGYGLYNFWMTDAVRNLDEPFEAAWDFRDIVHGHNNYLDIELNLGLIGGSIMIWFLFIGPMFNYARARRRPSNRRLADLFFMMIVFFSLLSFLETFFMARDDAMWLMHVFAIFGLHILARFDIDPQPNTLKQVA